jgi:hypothetical protein
LGGGFSLQFGEMFAEKKELKKHKILQKFREIFLAIFQNKDNQISHI